MRSDKVANSRYVQGGTSDSQPDRIGWWDRTIIPAAADDSIFLLTPRYHRRPDLLAADVYGSSTLMWIILQFNNVVNINSEFITGRPMRLPSDRRVKTQILTSRV